MARPEEGKESYESVSDLRQAHKRYWPAEVIRQLPRASRRTIDGDTLVVLERFASFLRNRRRRCRLDRPMKVKSVVVGICGLVFSLRLRA
jgi:hypothetical protein